MNSFQQTAPLMTVIALVGYCCWSDGDGPAADPRGKDKSSKGELTQALLAPASTPVPERNPFSSPAPLKKALAAPPARNVVKKDERNDDLAKVLSHLVLRATFVHGDRRHAMINDRFYREGDTLEAKVDGGKLKDDKKKDATLIQPSFKSCLIEKVLDDKVVLRCGDETMELTFPEKRVKTKTKAKTK